MTVTLAAPGRRLPRGRREPVGPARLITVNPLPQRGTVGQDRVMVGQLVMHLRGHAHPVVTIVPNNDNRPPISFEDLAEDQLVPRLASSQLLYLADFLQGHGYTVDGIQVADAYMSPVLDDTAAVISKTLVKAMRKHGAKRVRELLATTFKPYVVIGIDFTDTDLDSLSLKQDGVALGSSIRETQSRANLARTLTEAWKLAALQ